MHEYVVTLTWSEPTKAGAYIRFHNGNSAYLHCLDQGSIWHVLLTDNELKINSVLSLFTHPHVLSNLYDIFTSVEDKTQWGTKQHFLCSLNEKKSHTDLEPHEG